VIYKEKGDPRYKTLVFTPYEIGKQLITQYPHIPKYLSQGWYIAGHAVLINDRAKKAIKYTEKAIQISPSPTSEVHYYFVLADAYAEVADKKQIKSASSKMPSEYYEAEKKYRDITNMDREMGSGQDNRLILHIKQSKNGPKSVE